MKPPFDTELTNNLPKLRRMARGIARDQANADDLLQDTVIRMLQARDRFLPGTSFLGWAYRIMHNRHISLLRMNRKGTVDLDHPSVPALGHHASQESRIALNELSTAMRLLTADQRTALVLIAGLGLSYCEVAKKLSCSVGTIKSRVSRGREQLRNWLRPGETESPFWAENGRYAMLRPTPSVDPFPGGGRVQSVN